MKQGWFERNFGWIRDDFRRMMQALQQKETWIVLVMLTFLAIMIWKGMMYALGTDSTLRSLGHNSYYCREIPDFAIIAMFCGALALALSTVVGFGEFVRYQELKRRYSHSVAKSALTASLGWGLFGISDGMGMVLYLNSLCY